MFSLGHSTAAALGLKDPQSLMGAQALESSTKDSQQSPLLPQVQLKLS